LKLLNPTLNRYENDVPLRIHVQLKKLLTSDTQLIATILSQREAKLGGEF
jgi:hypothetical protein